MSAPLPFHDIGVIHGRFQVLHKDHLKYLLAGKRHCRHLVVGITNPDPEMTQDEVSDPERNRFHANPMTYYERYELLKTVLMAEGFKPNDFAIVPFPIHYPHRYRFYVPLDALFFLTIYDDWGRQKLAYFKSLGLRTHVLWNVPPEKKGISGQQVRRHMAQNAPWEHLVPGSAVPLLKKWRIAQRLKDRLSNGSL